jgi:diadenosine tetraphosphatase ApaH/serine/threonine PP2A family protein phosphatase
MSSDLQAWEDTLRSGQHLAENHMKQLCRKVTELLVEEPNVRPVSLPVAICGDVHGQFYDLLNLFKIGDEVSAMTYNYIFLGDLVDRGLNSVETLSLLFVLKLRYPEQVTLIRGNHESRQVTTIYGFYDECTKKYGSADVWQACCNVFDCFPIAALIDGKSFCVHGGLSPSMRLIDQMRLLNRRCEIPGDGPVSDLVWSDPDDVDAFIPSPRGAGFLFGASVLREFMHHNRIDLIARAHQLVQEGYRYHFDEQQLVTVWSAPNYVYRCQNMASILRIHRNEEREFVLFDEVADQMPKNMAEKTRPAYFL